MNLEYKDSLKKIDEKRIHIDAELDRLVRFLKSTPTTEMIERDGEITVDANPYGIKITLPDTNMEFLCGLVGEVEENLNVHCYAYASAESKKVHYDYRRNGFGVNFLMKPKNCLWNITTTTKRVTIEDVEGKPMSC